MTDIFAVETPTRTVGLAVRAEEGFLFYASDRAFLGLEGHSYPRLQDIQKQVRRLAEARQIPAKVSRTPAKARRTGRGR